MNTEEAIILRLSAQDRRYPVEAYRFIQEALRFAQEELEMGAEDEPEIQSITGENYVERHLTGQEFCDAIRVYALQQYGYLAKTVLNSLSLRTTQDFGNLVYNMISVGLMRKSRRDRREHFDNVYDFDDVFRRDYVFDVPE